VNHERYEDFLGELPRFAPDSRQADFFASVGPMGPIKKAKLDHHLGKVEIANVGRGWPASAPNLAFLQFGIKRLAELGKLDPRSKKDVQVFISWATQRVTRLTLSPETDGVYVRFWTRDDHGLYEHGFPVTLERQEDDESADGS